MGVPVADLYRKQSVRNASIYEWKAMYGGMVVPDARTLKVSEDENAKPRKLLAESMLDIVILKDVAAKMRDPPRLCRVDSMVKVQSG